RKTLATAVSSSQRMMRLFGMSLQRSARTSPSHTGPSAQRKPVARRSIFARLSLYLAKPWSTACTDGSGYRWLGCQSLMRLASDRALRVHVDRIERRARGHEQTVAIGAAEAEVGAALREADLADELAVGIEDVHAVQAFLPHAPAAPEVAVHVAAEAVRRAVAGIDELALVGELRA